MDLCVVKVGGSLLDWPETPQRLRAWLNAANAPVLLVVGGGAAADQVRAADRLFGFTADQSHDLALAAMNENSRRLAAWFATAESPEPLATLDTLDRVERWLAGPASPSSDLSAGPPRALVNVATLLVEQERRVGRRLVERSWRVTSDSLTAWLASTLRVVGRSIELTLLKSTGPGELLAQEKTLVDLARAGVVDECLGEYAAGIGRVRIVNLRAD